MHWLSPFFCLEGKFGPLEKYKDTKTTNMTVEIKFFRRTARYTLCDHKRREEILGELKV
jgi:hypothetical protein